MSSSRASTKRRPVVVEVAEIARGHHPVDHRPCRATVGVALEQQLVPDEDRPISPGGSGLAVLAEDGLRVLGGGRPAVPGASSRSPGVAIVAQAISVEP